MGRDIAMVFARLFVINKLIFTVPGFYFPLRLTVINIFTQGKLSNLFTFILIFAYESNISLYGKILNYLNYIRFHIIFISCFNVCIFNLEKNNLLKKYTRYNFSCNYKFNWACYVRCNSYL